MKYLVIDVGGSSIKYAVMDEDHNFIEKGKIGSRHWENADEFAFFEAYHQNDPAALEVLSEYTQISWPTFFLTFI